MCVYVYIHIAIIGCSPQRARRSDSDGRLERGLGSGTSAVRGLPRGAHSSHGSHSSHSSHSSRSSRSSRSCSHSRSRSHSRSHSSRSRSRSRHKCKNAKDADCCFNVAITIRNIVHFAAHRRGAQGKLRPLKR